MENNIGISWYKLLDNMRKRINIESERIYDDMLTFFQINLIDNPQKQLEYIETLFNETYKDNIIYTVVFDDLYTQDIFENRLPEEFPAGEQIRDMYIQASNYIQKYYGSIFNYCRSNQENIQVYGFDLEWANTIKNLLHFYKNAESLQKKELKNVKNRIENTNDIIIYKMKGITSDEIFKFLNSIQLADIILDHNGKKLYSIDAKNKSNAGYILGYVIEECFKYNDNHPNNSKNYHPKNKIADDFYFGKDKNTLKFSLKDTATRNLNKFKSLSEELRIDLKNQVKISLS